MGKGMGEWGDGYGDFNNRVNNSSIKNVKKILFFNRSFSKVNSLNIFIVFVISLIISMSCFGISSLSKFQYVFQL